MTIQEVSKKYDLVKDDYWFHKPSNQWIIKHSAVEKIAHMEGIKLVDIDSWNSETDLVRCKIIMSMPNGDLIKSIGEADRSNCFSQYLGCMAEKRGIDRCVLKGINAYEWGISSEVESEDFKRPNSVNEQSIEDEAEPTETPLPVKTQDTLKTADKGLKCPKCGKGIKDNRDINGDVKLSNAAKKLKDAGEPYDIEKSGMSQSTFSCLGEECKFTVWLETDVSKTEIIKEEDLPF